MPRAMLTRPRRAVTKKETFRRGREGSFVFRGLSWSQGPKRYVMRVEDQVRRVILVGATSPGSKREVSYRLDFLVVFLVVFLDDFLAAFFATFLAAFLAPPEDFLAEALAPPDFLAAFLAVAMLIRLNVRKKMCPTNI